MSVAQLKVCGPLRELFNGCTNVTVWLTAAGRGVGARVGVGALVFVAVGAMVGVLVGRGVLVAADAWVATGVAVGDGNDGVWVGALVGGVVGTGVGALVSVAVATNTTGVAMAVGGTAALAVPVSARATPRSTSAATVAATSGVGGLVSLFSVVAVDAGSVVLVAAEVASGVGVEAAGAMATTATPAPCSVGGAEGGGGALV